MEQEINKDILLAFVELDPRFEQLVKLMETLQNGVGSTTFSWFVEEVMMNLPDVITDVECDTQ